MSVPIYNPLVPFMGPIGGSLLPGRMVRIQGTVPHSADRFVVNFKCGPYERDDVALHLSVRFPQAQVVRNTLISQCWGPEETFGHMPFARGMGFELLVLCDPEHYKIAVNGQHFVEYIHRTPYERVTHLEIKQDVTLSLIQWEGGPANGLGAPGFVIPAAPVASPIMPAAPPVGTCGPAPPYPPYGGLPGCPPPPPPGHPPPPPGYPPPPPGYPPPPPGYPLQQPGYNHYHSAHKSSGGILDKAKAVISGSLGTGHGHGHEHGHGHGHGPGLGTALGAGLAGAAVTGHLSPKKALKAQKKARKKALKYGLPIAGIAGVGLGAYAAHKTLHGFHSSSSSSSSSSEEE